MSKFSIDELRVLVGEQSEGLCVSIYMPTYRYGAEIRQNTIRFKNLIKQAEAQLQAYELSVADASNFLQPAMDLDTDEFWRHQDQGLVIFLGENFLRYYRVPLDFEELVVVHQADLAHQSVGFHFKPLMQLFTRDSEFYILALSQNQVRFFEASRYSIQEQEVEGLPQNLEEALQYDETAKEGQFRIGTSAGNARPQQAGSFHGQGSPDRDEHQKDILQFFHQVNAALQDVLRGRTTPLLVAGVDYLLPIYQQANTYPHLLDAVIHSENIQVVKPEDLHTEALPLVEPFFSQAEQAAIEYYQEMTATGKTSTDPKEAIPAAYYGRVEQLVVPINLQQWGNFDMQENQLQLHPDAEPGDEDLLDAAAVQTILNGGRVFAVEPEKVPNAAPIAAVFRY